MSRKSWKIKRPFMRFICFALLESAAFWTPLELELITLSDAIQSTDLDGRWRELRRNRKRFARSQIKTIPPDTIIDTVVETASRRHTFTRRAIRARPRAVWTFSKSPPNNLRWGTRVIRKGQTHFRVKSERISTVFERFAELWNFDGCHRFCGRIKPFGFSRIRSKRHADP